VIAFDRASLACGVPSFEENDDPEPALADPLLQFHQFDL
jgi:hypothetical protein